MWNPIKDWKAHRLALYREKRAWEYRQWLANLSYIPTEYGDDLRERTCAFDERPVRRW